MPKTKARHKKLRQLDSDNGWTHVIRGPRMASTELNRPGNTQTSRELLQQQLYSNLELPDIRIKYHKAQQQWGLEPIRFNFEFLFQSNAVEGISIKNAMVLGLGSLAADNLESTSMHQFVLFEHWLSFLRTRYTITNVYFQDPRFHENDVLFLSELGYTVIADPEAYLRLNEHTFLFAPYLPWEVTYSLFYAAYPALMIGNGTQSKDSILQPARQEILNYATVRGFFSTRKMLSLAEGLDAVHERHVLWLRDMVVYWPMRASLHCHDAQLPMTSTGNHSVNDMNDFPGRFGPGEWRRGDGFVFDTKFKETLNHEIQSRENTDSQKQTVPIHVELSQDEADVHGT